MTTVHSCSSTARPTTHHSGGQGKGRGGRPSSQARRPTPARPTPAEPASSKYQPRGGRQHHETAGRPPCMHQAARTVIIRRRRRRRHTYTLYTRPAQQHQQQQPGRQSPICPSVRPSIGTTFASRSLPAPTRLLPSVRCFINAKRLQPIRTPASLIGLTGYTASAS